MKGKIPDLSKPSPIRIALRERRKKSIAEGDALVREVFSEAAWRRLLEASDEAVCAEIERQMG